MSMKLRLLAFAFAALATLAHGEIRTEPEVQPGTAAPEPKGLRLAPAQVAATRLAPFAVPKADVEVPGRPPKIGHARDVAELAGAGAASRSLAWDPIAGGRSRAAFSVTS